MTDMRKFLSEGTEALDRMDELIPTTGGPILNPLHHILNQLSVIQSHSKALKVLRNILMASAMLLCISTTFKPIISQETAAMDYDEERGWIQLVFNAARRFVFDRYIRYLFIDTYTLSFL